MWKVNTLDELIKAAIPALLNHPETKAALLDYIQALTDKERPKEEWRQVWWQLSEDVRRYQLQDPVTAVNEPKCRLYLVAHYSNHGVGVIRAQHEHEHFNPRHDWMYSGGGIASRLPSDDVFKVTTAADNYVDVIIAAQQAWADAYAKWVAETLPLDGDT